MGEIVVSIVAFLLLLLSGAYIVKESLRRKKQRKDDNTIEANYDIRIAMLAYLLGLIAIVGFTLAHYLRAFNNSSLLGYSLLCLVGLIFLIGAFLLGYSKVILNKEKNQICVYRFVFRKHFCVKEITHIKHSVTAWTAYSDKKRLFHISDKHNEYPSEFYIYICKESQCKQMHPKGYTSRDLD